MLEPNSLPNANEKNCKDGFVFADHTVEEAVNYPRTISWQSLNPEGAILYGKLGYENKVPGTHTDGEVEIASGNKIIIKQLKYRIT